MLCTYNEHDSALKRKEIVIRAMTWMNIEKIIPNEISHCIILLL